LPDLYTEIIREGGVVAFPTETVYGLGASAWNRDAIQKVFHTKGRPADNPLIVHVSGLDMVEDFAKEIPGEAKLLIDRFWPGPLTLIFNKKPEVLDIITAGLDTVAIRMPRHPLALALIRQAGPLVAPSANTSGKPSPTKPGHVYEDFGYDFPVINGGICDVGIESTVLDLSIRPFEIFRPGYVSRSAIEEILNCEILPYRQHDPAEKPKSPGMKYTHYSPDAAVRWLLPDEMISDPDTIYLLHSGFDDIKSQDNIVNYKGDFDAMTRELYDRFRQADREQVTTIVIQPFDRKSSNELLIALYNRISKAIGKNI
jgi:L-threonylcarbamoyladenylate synthase